MNLSEAYELFGKECHVQMSELIESEVRTVAFNGVLSDVYADSKEGVVMFPNGQTTLKLCLLEIHAGHATENVATEQDFEEAKANGEELMRGNDRWWDKSTWINH